MTESVERKASASRKIHKIGGANMSKLDQVENLVRHLEAQGERPILVVSAFEHVTKALIEALDFLDGKANSQDEIRAAFTQARKIIETVIDNKFSTDYAKLRAKGHVHEQFEALIPLLLAHQKETKSLFPSEDTYEIRDRVIRVGETSAEAVLQYFLEEKNIAAAAFPEVKCTPVNTNGEIQNKRALHQAIARGIQESMNKLPNQDKEKVLIMGGHVQGTTRGMVVDIGRSYSDTTAVDVAIALAKDIRELVLEVVFWKDVDGLSTANPRDLENGASKARVITHVSYDEAIELAGASKKSQYFMLIRV